MQSNANKSISSFNDSSSRNTGGIETLLKNSNQSSSQANKDKKSGKNELEESFNYKFETNSYNDLLDADESFLKSKLQSSSRKEKRRLYKEFLKYKDNPAVRAKAKLLMSSLISDDDSPFQTRSRFTNDHDDLKLSQTKMDEIVEVENEDQENEAFNDFINNCKQQQEQSDQKPTNNSMFRRNHFDQRYNTNEKGQHRFSADSESPEKHSDYRNNDSIIDVSKCY